jgi:RNA polymerase sigma-70 factor (ECF subfamily)
MVLDPWRPTAGIVERIGKGDVPMSAGVTYVRDDRMEDRLEDHRVALTGFCYRMLGSPFEAEDAVQETLVRAWRALDRFEGRAALRSWLFGIATNVCIDMLNAGRRRALPMDLGSPTVGDARIGAPLPEHRWVWPVANGLVLPRTDDPAEAAVGRESIRLAFVAALQHLSPRQRAVLILRDVLRWRASEVAELLDCTTGSVHSMLRRARAALAAAGGTGTPPAPAAGHEQAAVVERYVAAFERFDMDAVVELLHEDVVLSMPPLQLWMRGAGVVRDWFVAAPFGCRDVRLVPVEANGSPALASYRPRVDGHHEAFGIQVLDLSGDRVAGIHAFLDVRLFPLFGVPTAVPS